MFLSLVPLTVHNALEAYEARRKELVERQVERIREQNTLVNGYVMCKQPWTILYFVIQQTKLYVATFTRHVFVWEITNFLVFTRYLDNIEFDIWYIPDYYIPEVNYFFPVNDDSAQKGPLHSISLFIFTHQIKSTLVYLKSIFL